MTSCPTCGRACEEDENFCSNCAAPLRGRELPGDRGKETRRPDSAETIRPSRGALETLSEDLLAGQVGLIDNRYEVTEEFPQRGGEADVYHCRDREGGEEVAVKLYRVKVEPKQAVLDQLVGLSHKDIVSLKAYGTWGGRFYEVMEWACGGSLDSHAPFSEDFIVSIVLPQAYNALCFLHERNIIHRDMKPNNLFFRDGEKKDVVLGDFGVSSLVKGQNSVHQSRGFGGTGTYAAPEAYSGIFNYKTDYYSLGITTMYLLTGSTPFDGMNPQQIMYTKGQEPVEPPAKASKRLRALMRGLTLRSVDNRWGKSEVRRWLAGEDVPVEEDDTPASRDFFYKLAEGREANSPQVLGRLLYEDRDTAMQHYQAKMLVDGIKPYDQALALRFQNITNCSKNNEAALAEIIYILDPTLPYRLGTGWEAAGPAELAALIDSSPETWEQGKRHLQSEQFEAWLRATGRTETLAACQELRSGAGGNADLYLEAFLHLLDPSLAAPRLEASPLRLSIKGIRPGKRESREVKVLNATRGYLLASAALYPPAIGLEVSPETLSLHTLSEAKGTLDVTADTSQALNGKSTLQIESSAGAAHIQVSFSSIFSYPLLYPWIGLVAGGLAYLLIIVLTSGSSSIPLTPRKGWFEIVFNYMGAGPFEEPFTDNLRTFLALPAYAAFLVLFYLDERCRNVLNAVPGFFGDLSVILSMFLYAILYLVPSVVLLFFCWLLGGPLAFTLALFCYLGYRIGSWIRKRSGFPDTEDLRRQDHVFGIIFPVILACLFCLNIYLAFN